MPARVLERWSRRDQVDRIERLERQGLTRREIAERLGLAVSTVGKYLRDPEGESERTRRELYRGICLGCGRPTAGSDGPGRGRERCRRCAGLRRRSWSNEQMLAAIRDWARLTGAPPTLYDWSPAHAPLGHGGAARYLAEPRRWPSASSVARRFGSLHAAIEQASVSVNHSP